MSTFCDIIRNGRKNVRLTLRAEEKMKILVTMFFTLITFISCTSFKKVQFNPEFQIDKETGNLFISRYSKESGLNYIITYPKDYELHIDHKFPLIIFLHSMEERGDNIDLLISNPNGQGNGIIPSILNRDDVISISILCPKKAYWSYITNRLHKLVLEVIEENRIDKNKVLLTGVSMGGMGVWSFAMDFPELFSAVAPISAGVYSPPMKIKTSALRNIRIWAIHDKYDPNIPLEKELWFIDKLRKENIMVKYTITEYGKHYIHEEFYESGEIINWFLEE